MRKHPKWNEGKGEGKFAKKPFCNLGMGITLQRGRNDDAGLLGIRESREDWILHWEGIESHKFPCGLRERTSVVFLPSVIY